MCDYNLLIMALKLIAALSVAALCLLCFVLGIFRFADILLSLILKREAKIINQTNQKLQPKIDEIFKAEYEEQINAARDLMSDKNEPS